MPVFRQVTQQKSVFKASRMDRATRTPQAPPLPTHTQATIIAETRSSSPIRTPKYLAIPCQRLCMPETRLHLRILPCPPRSPPSPKAADRAAYSQWPPARSPHLDSRMAGAGHGRSSHPKPSHSSSTMQCCSQHTTRCRATVR